MKIEEKYEDLQGYIKGISDFLGGTGLLAVKVLDMKKETDELVAKNNSLTNEVERLSRALRDITSSDYGLEFHDDVEYRARHWAKVLQEKTQITRNSLSGKCHEQVPVPMILFCPGCAARHLDEGEFETKSHHTHACQRCGLVWRPALVPTIGVQFLPGFKNTSQVEKNEGTCEQIPDPNPIPVSRLVKNATTVRRCPGEVNLTKDSIPCVLTLGHEGKHVFY